ncbi:6-phosphofructokinase [bacterium]|nr:6-phosphofructokinase [candidate division CSSED10-310 bacterium]
MAPRKFDETQRPILAIVVGGGPAPGINGVISAATIEAINNGMRVIGIQDGFYWLAEGDFSHWVELTIQDVSWIHFQGGSILSTSRENPTKDPARLQNVIDGLLHLNVKYLVTIGGDDTAYTAFQVEKACKGKIKLGHVPKTIDNDLPLPGSDSTFGFQTARHHGVSLVQSLMEDARTTNRWFFIVTMGRKAGHLALGIGKAAGTPLTIISEEFKRDKISLKELADILEGSIIKRLAMGRRYGVAIVAEGLSEKIRLEDFAEMKDVERDEFGNIRYSEINLGRVIQNEVRNRLARRGLKVVIVNKNIGYELRCAPPIPFDIEYTRDLGFGVVRFLLGGGTGAMVTRQAGRIIPMYLQDLIDPQTNRMRVRYVNTNTEYYEVTRNYMIRLEAADFEDKEWVEILAKAGRLTPEEFLEKFGYMTDAGGF